MRLAETVAAIALAMFGCGSPIAQDPDAGEDGGAGRDAAPICSRDSDCAGTFCAPSRCVPGAPASGPDGCAPQAPPCSDVEICVEGAMRCLPADCATTGDADGDGDPRPECGGGDCNDSNGSIRSTTVEVCDPDGIDEDCNPETIRNPMDPSDGDADGDGLLSYDCFNVRDDESVHRGTDCDDTTIGDGLGTVDDCGSCRDTCVVACNDRVCEDYAEVAAGFNFTCARTTAGRVFCWGSNNMGQLGADFVSMAESAENVPSVADATTIAAGTQHVCVGRTTGPVVCWGSNVLYQLGDGSGGGATAHSPSPQPVLSDLGALPLGSNPAQLVAGENSSCALYSGAPARVYCWGANAYAQLGVSSYVGQPVSTAFNHAVSPTGSSGSATIAVGGSHVCAVQMDRSTCWGRGDLVGDGVADHGSTCSGRDCTLAVSVSELTDIVELSASVGLSCARDAGGTVRCWGSGATPTVRTDFEMLHGFALSIRDSASGFGCAIRDSGQAVCWGQNSFGELGDGTRDPHAMPVDVVGLTDAAQISTGYAHACAVRTNGSIVCWGSDQSGQLGNGPGAPSLCGPSGMVNQPCSVSPVDVVTAP